MSSLFSSILSYAGASLPVVFLAGLLWVTATVLDSDSSHSTRKRRVPVGWDSHDDEHLLFLSPPSSRARPSSVVRTVSSAFASLVPFSQPRSISSTSLVISCPSPLPSSRSSPLSSSRPLKKRPSARASSTGVSQTSTPPKTYSHLTSSQYRSSLRDEAVSKALRQGLLTYEAGYNVLYGRWSLSHAIDQSAKALAAPGRKNCPPVAERAGYPLADDDAYASLVLSLKSCSLSTPEKNEVSSARPFKEFKPTEPKMRVNAGVLIENPAETIFLPEPAPSAPIEPSAEATFFQPEPAPLVLPAPTSLAAKLKFDGFRCGSAPLAAFSRRFQLAQPDPPLLVSCSPVRSDAVGEMEMQDAPPVPLSSPPPVEHMVLDVKPAQATPNTQSSTTSISPGILRKVSQITKQFVNLQIQSSPAPVNFSPLVKMLARWSLNDKQQTSKARITQPASTPVPPPRTASQTASRQSPVAPSLSSSSSGQPSSVPATASPAKTEKKQIISAPAPAQPSSSATPKPLSKSAAPATPQRPAGQLSLPAIRPKSLFAAARKPLPKVARPKSTASSSSGQPPSAKATAIPATAEKQQPTPTASSSQPLPQPAAPTQAATSSSSGQSSSAPAQASAAKTETKKLATMGAVNSLLANMLDSFEAEETEAKAEKPKPTPKPAPKPEPKPEPEPEPTLGELSFEEIESQLALEEMELLKEEKEVPKYKGKDRKIAPLRRK